MQATPQTPHGAPQRTIRNTSLPAPRPTVIDRVVGIEGTGRRGGNAPGTPWTGRTGLTDDIERIMNSRDATQHQMDDDEDDFGDPDAYERGYFSAIGPSP